MGVDDWIAREGRTCPRCKSEDCRRWESQQAGKVLPDWKQKELDDDCAFTANACPTCKGKCCRDSDMGYRVEHMGAECYEHHCDDCRDGQVPAAQAQPDPRDALIAELRAEVEKLREAVRVLPKYTAQSFDLNCFNTRTANSILAAARKLAGLEEQGEG